MEANHESGATELSVDGAAEALLSKWDSDEPTQETPVQDEQETTEEVTEELEAVAESSDQSDVQEPDNEEEALEFESLSQIAEALEMSQDDFLNKFNGKIKVDGEESEISLSEALHGYQRQADYQRKTAELADQRRQFDEAVKQQQAEWSQYNNLAQASLQAAQDVLLKDFQEVNWQELETADPGTAALYRQKFQERQQDIQNHHTQLMQAQQQQAQQLQEQQYYQRQQLLAEQQEMLSKAAPDWTQDTSKQLGEYLMSNGYSQSEVDGLIDHRAALMARKAMLYDQQQKSVEVAKAKVKTLPRMLKPGNKNQPKAKNADQIKSLKGKLKRSGSVQDAAALLLERMN